MAEVGGQWSVVEFEDSGVRDVPSVAELMFPDVSNAARSLEMSGNNAATEGICNENSNLNKVCVETRSASG